MTQMGCARVTVFQRVQYGKEEEGVTLQTVLQPGD